MKGRTKSIHGIITPQFPSPRWWLNQPIWKICSSNWIIPPRIRDENKKHLSCHHPGMKMYSLLKLVIFYCHVSLLEGNPPTFHLHQPKPSCCIFTLLRCTTGASCRSSAKRSVAPPLLSAPVTVAGRGRELLVDGACNRGGETCEALPGKPSPTGLPQEKSSEN